jgi:hypothetical protein
MLFTLIYFYAESQPASKASRRHSIFSVFIYAASQLSARWLLLPWLRLHKAEAWRRADYASQHTPLS